MNLINVLYLLNIDLIGMSDGIIKPYKLMRCFHHTYVSSEDEKMRPVAVVIICADKMTPKMCWSRKESPAYVKVML